MPHVACQQDHREKTLISSLCAWLEDERLQRHDQFALFSDSKGLHYTDGLLIGADIPLPRKLK